MALFDSIKSTLAGDLGVAEKDAEALAKTVAGETKTTFTGLLDMVLQQVEARPIGQILEAVYDIYKEVKGDPAAVPPAAATPPAA